jgi:isopentenyl phosphate kinase
VGHGSGSFGHIAAAKYRVHEGIDADGDWWGYAETAAVAAGLNQLVTESLIEAGIAALSIQPSASARCRSGALTWLEIRPIQEALCKRLVPLVYGDVAFDTDQGCTIVSTEAIFAYLAARLQPTRIVLVGQVDGVYDRDPLADPSAEQIAHITPQTYPQIRARLGNSHAVDVTGGMLDKVREMVQLVADGHTRQVYLVSGQREGALWQALLGKNATGGTLIAEN